MGTAPGKEAALRTDVSRARQEAPPLTELLAPVAADDDPPPGVGGDVVAAAAAAEAPRPPFRRQHLGRVDVSVAVDFQSAEEADVHASALEQRAHDLQRAPE